MASCLVDSTDCTFDGTCAGPTAGNDAGSSGEGGPGPGPGRDADADSDGSPPVIVPEKCDLTKSPKESPACIEEGVGVFVSPTGKEGAAGTKVDPLRSIGEAATRGKPRVYVCAGAYETAVTLAKPIAIFGGLSCAWEPTGARPKLAPPKGVALKITKVSGPVLIQDIDVVGSADAAVPGDSAIAAFVSESTDVTFRNVSLTSGAGTAGATGGMTSNYSGTATVGGMANGAVGGVGPSCSCLDGNSSKGGNGAAGNGVGIADGVALPPIGGLNAGFSSTGTCGVGLSGANGLANPGGDGQTLAGSLGALGWVAPSTNTPRGSNGNPAQGGGGGGARTASNFAGGGGGCGGCGGGGGEAGLQGGSSFALLSFQSTVSVIDGQLQSGPAGIGGTGGNGQGGQAAGSPGEGICNGGAGGNGAGGSGGGGGAGGHSVPVAYVGKEPTVTGAPLVPGQKGGSGPGGPGGLGPGNPGNPGKPGAEGKSQDKLAL